MRTISHPTFCDPRLCRLSVSSLDHREAPLGWKPVSDDRMVAVGLSRLDEAGMFDIAGDTEVVLGITEPEGTGTFGPAEIALSPSDARLLAAALSCAADRAEADRAVAA